MQIIQEGGIRCNVLTVPKLTPMPRFAQRYNRLAILVAAPTALLLSQGQAKAVLIYNIFESAGNVVVQTSGSLNLPLTSIGSADCRSDGGLLSVFAVICTGPQGNLALYGITGSPSFNGSVADGGGSSVSATSTFLVGDSNIPLGFSISFGYISGSPIVSASTFTGQTLSSLGFTINSGLLGSWTLDGTGDTIQAFLGPPGCSSSRSTPPAWCWGRLRLESQVAQAHRRSFDHTAPGLIAALIAFPRPAIGGAFLC